MFERFSRSWMLIKASGAILRQDKAMLIFPLCAFLSTGVLIASFIAPLIYIKASHFANHVVLISWLVFGFLFYLSQYFVVVFCNAALIGAALIRLDGRRPTVADGFSIAFSKFGCILGYVLIAATIGIVLRIIAERTEIIGRAVAGLLGVAFTAATFLVVPVLVSSEIGPMEAAKESAGLLKKSWGENIMGNAGMGLVFAVFYLLAIMSGVALAVLAAPVSNSGWLVVGAVVLSGCLFLVVALVHSALQGIYSAALYRYAVGDGVVDGFETKLLQTAFKGRQTGDAAGWGRGNI
jgi:hypothetical protein